ncbi:MAG: chorismate mutase [Sphaerochaeta sp.]|uniref:chorismate mutase n=1 Tax=Sphaerochaeta sp. TaxID=1972642 RepID=UPI001D54037A|nr:chorismate mutase [uncultured Sphaerochaeta sp.]MDD3058407.1 chorismate mutase [Sphaerochaeta sp.]MDD3928662.1 chorismate mutase [Sphaerochaeta sp.]NCC12751.1 chorismate mutase [Spirochaetia bacterium]NCC89540.1 chorismate mutase [Spirochaetia bacterium]
MNTGNICAIRGAICIEADEPDRIEAGAVKLFRSILERNGLQEEQIACLLITQTGDLRSRNPATGLRKASLCAVTPLFCMQELEIEGMLERVIRMLVILNCSLEKTVPVFLDGAEKLRPDLALQTLGIQ